MSDITQNKQTEPQNEEAPVDDSRALRHIRIWSVICAAALTLVAMCAWGYVATDGEFPFGLFCQEEPEEPQEEELPHSFRPSDMLANAAEEGKPVLYLYPTKETDVSVRLARPDAITVSYPDYGNGWHVIARPDGTLTDAQGGRSLYSLYYEAELDAQDSVEKMDEGFVVARDDLAEFLETSLARLGLTEREAEEMIVWWLPKMQEHEFCYVRFALTDDEQERSAVIISPEPDYLIRIRMVWKGLDDPIEGVAEQKLPDVNRDNLDGFVAVEWGGTEIQ